MIPQKITSVCNPLHLQEMKMEGQSRAAKIAAALNTKMQQLADRGEIDKTKLEQPKGQEQDTFEKLTKRSKALEKLRTFLD